MTSQMIQSEQTELTCKIGDTLAQRIIYTISMEKQNSRMNQ